MSDENDNASTKSSKSSKSTIKKSKTPNLLDDAFAILDLATRLENENLAYKQAATKYRKGCDLLERYLKSGEEDVTNDDDVQSLIADKIRQYRAKAMELDGKGSAQARPWLQPHTAESFDNGAAPSAPPLVHSMSSVSVIPVAECQILQPSMVSITVGSTRSIISSVTDDNPQQQAQPEWELEVTHLSGQANKLFSNALDLDEGGSTASAIDMYLEAAQLFLKAFKIADEISMGHASNKKYASESMATMLKRRLENIMDRVEELKSNKATSDLPPEAPSHLPSPQPRHRRTPSSGSVGSAQSSVRSAGGNGMPKAPRAPPSSSSTVKDAALQNRKLTKEEIAVLKRSSLIASGVFLPWIDDEVERFDFRGDTPGRPYSDPDGRLRLSESQKKSFYRWARPQEIVAMRSSGGGSGAKPVMVQLITPYTIRQKCVTDCSFIASLCICAAYERRFRRRLVTTMIYPQNAAGIPIYNPAGKYLVKLWLNGVARRVVVDDEFPVDRKGNLLCSHSTAKDAGLELWVSIIEKAYMKLCGGYDFPGSNSGVDLFSLTGWIPERVYFPEDESKIRDFETPSERAWERLYNASNFGDCLITAATSSKLSEAEADTIGLVTGHAYAVLNVIRTRNGTRLLQLKNPWAHKGWKGRFSCHDRRSWEDSGIALEIGYNYVEAARHDDGIFWISWEDILVYFHNLHLSWNPSLFESKITVHGYWPKDMGPTDDSFNVGENPQYILTLSETALQRKATVWILLSRHVAKQEQEGAQASDFLTLHIYRNANKKDQIVYPGGKRCVLNGAYTNNPHVLIRYDIEGPEDKYLSLVFSQYQKSNDLGYSMSCYCTSNFVLGRPVKTPQHKTELSSEWTKSTSGGNPTSTAFYTNPAWAVSVPHGGAFLQLKCSAVKTLPVNIMLLRAKGKEINKANLSVDDESLFLDTGDYRQGFVSTGVQFIPPGLYAMIASAFYQGKTGKFKITAFSSIEAVTITPLEIDR